MSQDDEDWWSTGASLQAETLPKTAPREQPTQRPTQINRNQIYDLIPKLSGLFGYSVSAETVQTVAGLVEAQGPLQQLPLTPPPVPPPVSPPSQQQQDIRPSRFSIKSAVSRMTVPEVIFSILALVVLIYLVFWRFKRVLSNLIENLAMAIVFMAVLVLSVYFM